MRAFTYLACFSVLFTLIFNGVAASADASSLFLTKLPTSQWASRQFVVYQTISLDPRETGIAGALQIMQDKRVTDEYRQTWGASADPFATLGPDNAFVKSLAGHPLENGRLRLIDSHGHILALYSFAEPLARISKSYLYGTIIPTFLVTVDYGIGLGPYAGPATTFVEIRNRKLIDLPIELGSSLQNSWKIVSAPDGGAKEIEVVQCHPNFNNPNWTRTDELAVDYTTYRFEKGRWIKTSIEKVGYWESDDRWPPRSAFP